MSPELANKIAAGEVVQRPASVVKELLDNAIDAGATRIVIRLEAAGKERIQVEDNGCGMSPADLQLCLEAHATSKIKAVEDLQSISTLGFRGEAMASIASVSQMEVRSQRLGDEIGHRLVVHGGQQKTFEPAAVEPGTRVQVDQLFYNVPARKRFLRTDATELKNALQVVQQIGLANPEVHLECFANGEPVYQLPAVESYVDRAVALFGSSFRASLIPVQEDAGLLRVRGVISDPKLTKKTRGEQFFFVNRRPIQHKILMYHVLKVYEPWTQGREFPFFALFLEMDPEDVDVNVHPAKLEVKFSDERSVQRLVASVVRKTLNQALGVPNMNPGDWQDGQSVTGDGASKGEGSLSGGSFTSGKGGSTTNPMANFEKGLQSFGFSTLKGESGKEISDTVYGTQEPKQGQTVADLDSSAKNFWQLHRQYVLSHTRSGLCMIDQYLAHRRILFDRAMEDSERALPSSQQLLFAQTIELSASDFELVKELEPELVRMGFSVDLLSGRSVMLSGVPADLSQGGEKSILQEVLDQFRELDHKKRFSRIEKVAIAYAVHAAIPRGKLLTMKEMEALMDQLFACQDPWHDPLGRQIVQMWSMEDLASYFS
jgi:DNA mismatch repair protein MutL